MTSPRLLRKGGVILADNILRRGLVANDSEENPWAAGVKVRERSEYEKDDDLEALREYNDLAIKSDRLDTLLMPLFDGIGMSALRD